MNGRHVEGKRKAIAYGTFIHVSGRPFPDEREDKVQCPRCLLCLSLSLNELVYSMLDKMPLLLLSIAARIVTKNSKT